MRYLTLAVMLVAPWPCLAETLTPSRVIRANEIISPSDLTVLTKEVRGALTSAEEVTGLEAKRTLYPGRPLYPGDLIQPALVDRNQLVLLRYNSGPLEISAEGRALARGAAGERIRVMNLGSRTTVSGTITADGSVIVGN